MQQNLPGQGATYLRRTEVKPGGYTFQAFPTTRYHEDGRVVADIQTEEDEMERCPPSEGWVKTPFPPRPTPPKVVERTAAEANAEVERQAKIFDASWKGLTREHEALRAQHAELAEKHEKLNGFCAEQSSEIAATLKQLTEAQEQIATLTEPPPQVGVPPQTAAKAKQPKG